MGATRFVLPASLVLFLAAIPLVSHGATQGRPSLWWAGLALMTIAGVLPPLSRLAHAA